jgi:glycosyltransferase involved in cell wall biosynthesis
MSEKLQFKNPNLPRIGLNGRFLSANRTGVQRASYRLFHTIIEKGTHFNFILFTSEQEKNASEWKKDNVQVITSPLKLQRSFQNYFWEQWTLPKLMKKYNCSLLHNPANLAPLLCGKKNIVHIHDLCFLIEPQWFSFNFRWLYKFLVPKISQKALLVLTNSNHSKNDILELLPVNIEKIRHFYWGVEPIFHQDSFKRPWSQKEDRILFVGSLEPRKNLPNLLLAYNKFRETHFAKLTIVGCHNPVFADHSYSLGKYKDDIEFLGYIPDSTLADLYSRSKVLIYPSFYEGFGLPPLEAMAVGTPVISSHASSLPEILDHAALYVDPKDSSSILNKLNLLWTDQSLAKDLISKGYLRIKAFDWNDIADYILSLYSSCLKTQI